jgi:hypothetical protein
MVAGNHDAPRTSETGCILRLFAELGVHVVDGEPMRLAFPERELSVLAVPDVPGVRRPPLEPDPAARYNVLLLHGEVQGMLSKEATPLDRAAVEISREDLGAARWDYVALGHYHVYREVEPNAYYSGSIDYTSANAWGELVEERQAGIAGKGIIERDLATGAHAFHPLQTSRPLVDLAPVSARGMSAAELDAAIRGAVESVAGGIDEKVVRLVVRDVPRHVARELDHKALREYKRRATHFHLDTRRPEILRAAAGGAPGRRPSLADTVRDKLRARLLPSDVDRDALVALGLRYLEEADAVVAAQGPRRWRARERAHHERGAWSAERGASTRGSTLRAPRSPLGAPPRRRLENVDVRLVSLRLVNFRQHADSFVTFDSGLTGIIGPNGAGKTTILEGIAWALYGNSAARGTRDSIRFARAAPRSSVRVELEFDLAGHRYRVVRASPARRCTSTARRRRSPTRSPPSASCCSAGSGCPGRSSSTRTSRGRRSST